MTLVAEQDLAEIAPCTVEGPLAAAARDLINAADALGASGGGVLMRSLAIPYLFNAMETGFANERDPTPAIVRALATLTSEYQRFTDSVLLSLGSVLTSQEEASTIEATTGAHYAGLFGPFANASFWEEPKALLQTRLERNGFSVESLRGKSVLDAGCGGGRYSVAWRLIGASPVIGVDISPSNVQDATSRVRAAGVDGVEFKVASVLDLPFQDGAFDVAFSNGVLHHTSDWRRGLRELVRVLKPGGLGWLYLIENPGGLFWDVIEVLRAVTRRDDSEQVRRTLGALGFPANRVFYMVDHVKAPINLRLKEHEIETALASSGAKAMRRLTRGADFDRVERLFAGDAFAEVKFGVGEHRFVFSK